MTIDEIKAECRRLGLGDNPRTNITRIKSSFGPRYDADLIDEIGSWDFPTPTYFFPTSPAFNKPRPRRKPKAKPSATSSGRTG